MVFASKSFVSAVEERAFRDSVAALLRAGKPDEALVAVDEQLHRIGESPIAQMALSIDPASVSVLGFGRIAETIDSLDRHGQPISAIGIALAEPDEAGDRAENAMQPTPIVHATFYCDEVYAFGSSDRAAMDKPCSAARPPWQGLHEHMDTALGLSGIEAIHGVYQAMLPYMERGELTDLADYDAPRFVAMRCAILLHMAVARAVESEGLPRAMTVVCGGSNYPGFLAPVLTRDEYEDEADAQAEAGDTDEALFTSLTTLAPTRREGGYRFTPETEHLTGRSLRHMLVREAASEIADPAVAEVPQDRPSLLGRLFRRAS